LQRNRTKSHQHRPPIDGKVKHSALHAGIQRTVNHVLEDLMYYRKPATNDHS